MKILIMPFLCTPIIFVQSLTKSPVAEPTLLILHHVSLQYAIGFNWRGPVENQ